MRVMGASFCHVDKISPVNRSRPCSTSGSQKCIGARPTFSPSDSIVMVMIVGWNVCCTSQLPVNHAFIVVAKRIIAAAVACVRKYFVVASTARGWWSRAMRGRMAKVLISSPIQASSQCELANVTVVPRPRLIRKMEITYGLISKGGILTIMFGVWARKLN